ncbi:MAG TPA: hypothetical protein VNU92_16625, partial [Edaphobacter sp.]|nr:hypothetical protein [Edaphobacter sp.]
MADQPSIGELSTPPPISGEMPTSVTAFVDFFASGPINTPTPIASFLEFQQTFGGLDVRSESSYQVWQFFSNGGEAAIIVRIAPHPSIANFVSALNSALADLTVPFNLLCLPATTNLAPAEMNLTLLAAQAFCTEKNAFYIVDIPPSNVISTAPAIESWFAGTRLSNSDFAAVYYPQLSILDPLNGNAPREMPASGSVAGIYATTDSTRGVWKAPAG